MAYKYTFIVHREPHNGFTGDHYYGPFADREKAEDFCATVNALYYKVTIIAVNTVEGSDD